VNTFLVLSAGYEFIIMLMGW